MHPFVDLRDRYFVNPRETLPRSIRVDGGESGVSSTLGCYPSFPGYLAETAIRKRPRAAAYTKLSQKICYSFRRGINFVSNLHFVACRRSSASLRLTALAASARARGIYFRLVLCHRRPARYFRKWRGFRHFVKLMKLRLRRLCAIFWTRRGGVHEGLRK